MGQIFEIPFNAGQDESIDRALMPDGVLRLMQNCRLSREGRIEARPAFVALNMTEWNTGATFTAFDLATFEDRLLAFGSPFVDRPTDVFTYIDAGRAAWKGLFDVSSFEYSIFPFVSDLETVWTGPTGLLAVGTDVAYTNGYTCVCATDPGTGTSRAWVLKGDVVIATTFQASTFSMRVVACGTRFILLQRNNSGSIVAYVFDTNGTSAAFSTGNALVAGFAATTFTWDATPCGGSTDFVICYPDLTGADIEVARFTSTGTVSAASLVWDTTINVTPGNMACIASATLDAVVLGYVDASSNLQLYTLDCSSGVVTDGPTNVLGPGFSTANCVGTPALAFVSTTRVMIECSANTGTTVRSLNTVRDFTSHALVSSGDSDDVFISSKLYTQSRTTSGTVDMAQGVGTCTVFGNNLGTDMLFANTIQSVQDGHILAARWNYGFAGRLNDSRVTNYHGRSSIATDGAGTFYAVVNVLDEGQILTTGAGTVQLVRFKSGSSARRQAAEMHGALYIAGGFVAGFDGATLFEAGGFLDTPVIFSNTQATAGALTQLATYNYVATYEWRDAKGRTHRSAASAPFEVVMTGTNDENTLSVSTAHSLRRADARSVGSVVNTVLFRTTPDDSVLYRVGTGAATAGITTYADVITINDRISDTDAQDNSIIYTQAQKPIENVGFYPCRFIAAGRDRLIMGGLPDPYMVAFSQLPFPAEPMQGADIESDFAYQARLPEKVTGVAAFGDSYIAFTEEGIYEIPGAGPQRNGTGEFFTPRSLYSDGGCIDWRSIVSTSFGTMFQMATDKIYMIAPDGSINFVGKRVRDTLKAFPVVRGAILCTETQRVAFAVVDDDDDPTDGGLLIYDLVHDAWSFDNVGVTQALVEYDGRIAYIQSGVVYLEQTDVAVSGSALPTMSVRTGSFRPFTALGRGDVVKIGLLGTFLGDCTVNGFISYDDGKTWTAMDENISVTTAAWTNAITGAAIASGDPITILFTPNVRNVDRFAVRFDVTNASSNSGGIRMHVVSFEVEAQDGMVRRAARDQR